MFHFTEIICRDWTGEWNCYFYVNAKKALRNVKNVLDNRYVPDGLRLVIEEYQYEPYQICGNIGLFTYLYRKYLKKGFRFGYRVNWEKELKKYLES